MKKQKIFVVRIDLESDKGIREGLPKILELFRKHDVKGSFYLVMGGESNLFEILLNRSPLKSAGERSIRLWSLKEKLRMLLFPKDFVKTNKKILQRILQEGHELGMHGRKHREWTRNLDNVPVKKRLTQMISRYEAYFKQSPKSWSSPGFNINKKVLRELNLAGIKYISDFDRKGNFEGLENIPINLCGKHRMPFIEYWVGQDKTDSEILEIFKKEIKGKKFVSFYLHGMFEGRYKIDLLEKMILELKKQHFVSKKIGENLE